MIIQLGFVSLFAGVFPGGSMIAFLSRRSLAGLSETSRAPLWPSTHPLPHLAGVLRGLELLVGLLALRRPERDRDERQIARARRRRVWHVDVDADGVLIALRVQESNARPL